MFKGEIANRIDYNEIAKIAIQKVPIYYDKNRIWYKWNFEQTKWEMTDEIDILNSIKEEMKLAGIYQNHIKNQILNSLQMEARKNKPNELQPNEIQYKNQIINIQNNNIREATPQDFSFNPIPWNIGTSEETPKMDEIITQWVGINNLIKIQQWIAYNMLNTYPIHRVACFTGSGSNGKSTLIRLIKKIIGEHNISAGELNSVFVDRFGATYLHRKLSCVMGETNFGRITKTSTFKSATGEDPIRVEYKGKTGFTYTNYAKITICTNKLPITEDQSDGFYRRWLIIHFPNQFTEKTNIIEQIPEIEYRNFCKKSIKLIQQILKEGQFEQEGTIQQRKEQYEKTSDPLQKFLQEQTIEDPDEYTFKKDFSEALRNWLKQHKQRTMTDIEIGKRMKETEHYYAWGQRTTGQKERVWLGIKLIPKALNTNTS